MKKCLFMLVVLAIGLSAQAAMVAQYSFESNLNDTATGGTTADNLVGMRYYPGNGKFDGGVTSYNPDGTTESLTTAVTNPHYAQGIVGSAVRIGARGVYNYTGTNVYPDASTYQVPGINAGATYLSSTADSADLSLGGEFTMEGFFKADAVGGIGGVGEFDFTRLITKWCSGFNMSYHFTIYKGALDLIQKNAAGGTVRPAGAVSIVADKWFYVGATGDSEFVSIYFYTEDSLGNIVGGQVGTAAAYAGTMFDSSDPLWIGGRADVPNSILSNNVFIGLVDEVQLWNEYKDASYFAARAEMIPEPITMVMLALGGLLIRRK